MTENRTDEAIELLKAMFEAIRDINEEITKNFEAFLKCDEAREPHEEPEPTPYLMPTAPEVFPPAQRWRKNRAFFRPKNSAGTGCNRKRGVFS